jgi:hypothetical protein
MTSDRVQGRLRPCLLQHRLAANGEDTRPITLAITIMMKMTSMSTLSLLLALSTGCGRPPEAGSINMTKAKEAAAARGVPQRQFTATPPSKNVRTASGRPPTKALPKGDR